MSVRLSKRRFLVLRFVLSFSTDIASMSAEEQQSAGTAAQPSADAPSGAAAEAATQTGEKKKPVVVLCIGMAGSVSATFAFPFGHRPGCQGRPSRTRCMELKGRVLTVSGQDHTHAATQLVPPLKRHATLHPQPRPCRYAHALLCQYRHQGYSRLQGGHEAVSSPATLFIIKWPS